MAARPVFHDPLYEKFQNICIKLHELGIGLDQLVVTGSYAIYLLHFFRRDLRLPSSEAANPRKPNDIDFYVLNHDYELIKIKLSMLDEKLKSKIDYPVKHILQEPINLKITGNTFNITINNVKIDFLSDTLTNRININPLDNRLKLPKLYNLNILKPEKMILQKIRYLLERDTFEITAKDMRIKIFNTIYDIHVLSKFLQPLGLKYHIEHLYNTIFIDRNKETLRLLHDYLNLHNLTSLAEHYIQQLGGEKKYITTSKGKRRLYKGPKNGIYYYLNNKKKYI